MQHPYFALVALEIAQQRVAEATAERLAAIGHSSDPRFAGVRRLISRFALAVARAADEEVGQIPLATH